MSAHRHRVAPRGVFESYWEAVSSADASGALASLDRGLASGQSHGQLVRDVVARAQERVGRLWETGDCTIADEHAASSVAEQSLAALRPRRLGDVPTRRIVLACPEGEWHTLPARMAADLASDGGLDVVVTGGGVPAAHLGLFLRQTRAAALALSVTMTVNLVSAWRSIQMAHLVGVPVIVGGAAWGPGHERAHRLGADLRVEDPAETVQALDLLAEGGALRQAAPVPGEAELLAVWGDQWARSSQVETMLAQGAAAAVACAEPAILDEITTWLARSPRSGGVTTEALRAARAALADQLGEVAPAASALLRR